MHAKVFIVTFVAIRQSEQEMIWHRLWTCCGVCPTADDLQKWPYLFIDAVVLRINQQVGYADVVSYNPSVLTLALQKLNFSWQTLVYWLDGAPCVCLWAGRLLTYPWMFDIAAMPACRLRCEQQCHGDFLLSTPGILVLQAGWVEKGVKNKKRALMGFLCLFCSLFLLGAVEC